MSNTITLPGGVVLTLPNLPQFPGFPQTPGTPTIPTLPTLPTLPQGGDLSGILAALLPLLGTASPQLALIVQLLGIVLNIGHAIHTQTQGQPAGSNPSLDAIAQAFWQHVTQAFPHPQPAQPTQPAAG